MGTMLNALVTKVALDLIAVPESERWRHYVGALVVIALAPIALVSFLVGSTTATIATAAVTYCIWAYGMARVRSRMRHLSDSITE